MTDSSSYQAADDDTDVEPDRGPITGLPRWVKVSGLVVLALIVLLVILQLTGVSPGGHDPGGRGDHGLGDNATDLRQEQEIADDGGDRTPLAGVLVDGMHLT